jgi:hypothetical protein
LGKNAGGEKVEIRDAAGGNPTNARHHLAEQHQPQYGLHRAGQQFYRVVIELLNLGCCHGEDLRH